MKFADKIISFLLIFMASVIFAAEPAVKFDDELFLAFKNIPTVKRDTFFESKINSQISARGLIKSIDSTSRYQRSRRIIVEDDRSKANGILILYYIFTDASESNLSVNSFFEFTGQIKSYTPSEIKKNSYILDIVLDNGAVILKQ